MARMLVSSAFSLVIALACNSSFAADAPSSSISKPRTGTTQKFGSGTITNRSDGSKSTTRPFGSGSITTERDKSGKTVTGTTQKFGSGTITNRSDGSKSTTRPFGSGSITTDKPGKSSSSSIKKK